MAETMTSKGQLVGVTVPTVGRIVHFRDQAAIVTHVANAAEMIVSLIVFPPGKSPVAVENVGYGRDWCWPPRA